MRGSIGKSKSEVERDGRRKSGGIEDTRPKFSIDDRRGTGIEEEGN